MRILRAAQGISHIRVDTMDFVKEGSWIYIYFWMLVDHGLDPFGYSGTDWKWATLCRIFVVILRACWHLPANWENASMVPYAVKSTQWPGKSALRVFRSARTLLTALIRKNNASVVEHLTLSSGGNGCLLSGKFEFKTNISTNTLALASESDIVWSLLRRIGIGAFRRLLSISFHERPKALVTFWEVNNFCIRPLTV